MALRNGKAMSLFVACALTAGIAFPATAWATVDENQVPATDEEIQEALAEGIIKTEGQEAASASVSEDEASALSSKISSTVSVSGYAGASMFETAVAEAKAAYPSGSSTAVIVGPGDAWVDALASAGLAASKGPILFTERDSLYPATRQALKDLGVKSVVIVGGTAAISAKAEKAIADTGISVEARLAGADCYETQMKIYEYGMSRSLWNKDLAIIATGMHYGDALSVSPVAYAKKAPIFLTDSSLNLSDEQLEVLRSNASNGYGKTTIVVGGPASISDYTLGEADYVSLLAGGSGQSNRLWGEDQYATSAEIADWAVGSQGFTWNKVAFATGRSPYDALAGSVLQGVSRSVLLLVDGYGSSTIVKAGENKASIKSVRFFGGESTVTMRERMGVADKLNFPYAALPGFRVYVDAGHGQNDLGNGTYASGAVGNGYQEATLNKELATMVTKILRNEYGVSVFLNDDGGPYKYRHAEAIAQGCDAITSIHFNSSGGGGASGTLSLIHNYNASFLSESWQGQIHPFLIRGVGLRDLGQNTQEVAILGGYLPSTLLEVCFIDNGYDIQTYQSRKAEIAHKIAEGIVS